MQEQLLKNLIGAVNGQTQMVNTQIPFQEISTDSRTITTGSVFFAIVGQKLDGDAHVEAALEKGAVAAVVAKRRSYHGENIIYVSDTTQALCDFARFYRNQFSPFLVGVTGSVGKTTTKEMIYAVLSAAGPTLKTQGNLNNEIGLPKTLLELQSKHRYGVIEMGMSNLGEISRLSRTTCPAIGVITNIGVSHLETLKTRDNILKAKLEILDGMPAGAPLIVNGDNDLLSTVAFSDRPVIPYGIENPEVDYAAREIREENAQTIFVVKEKNYETQVTIPCIGLHNVLNALAAFSVGVQAGMDRERIAEALMRYQPAGMRQRIVSCRNVTVIEDCYNASPDSMTAALSILERLPCQGKRIAVLGDMLELGDFSCEAHKNLGRQAAERKVDLLLCFGAQSRFTVKEAQACGMREAYHFDSKKALCDYLLSCIRPGDLLLCKGSRSMAMEQVLQQLYSQWEG